MEKLEAKDRKNFAILTICLLAGIVIVYVVMSMVLKGSKKWDICLEDFDAYHENFQAMVQLSDYLAKEQRSSILFVDTEKPVITDFDGNTVILGKTEANKLRNIQNLFRSKNLSLSMIYVDDEGISFSSLDESYAIMYTREDQAPSQHHYLKNYKEISTKKIRPNWYHVVFS